MIRRLSAAMVAVALTTAGCAVPLPKSDDVGNTKVAATRNEVANIYDRYKRVRKSALHLLDDQPLTAIESGPVLAIDSGAIAVARQLLLSEEADDSQDLEIEKVLAPRLDSYPMWFVTVTNDGVRDLTKVQIFQRATAVSTWELVASPEMLTSVPLPALQLDQTGALEPVAPDESETLSISPRATMRAYATVLNNPSSPEADLIEAQDSFVAQMRTIADAQDTIPSTRFSQQWSTKPVQYALRTADGGALVFATLGRTDRYRIKEGTAIDWPERSEQKAFLSGQLYSEGVLDYYHQVLVFIPGEGQGKPRVLGQYGGVVRGVGS